MEQQRSNNRLHIPCMHLTVFKLGAEGRSLHRNSDPSLQTRAAWNLHEETEEDDKLFEEQIESMIAGIMGPEESFGYSSTVRAKSEILTCFGLVGLVWAEQTSCWTMNPARLVSFLLMFVEGLGPTGFISSRIT